MTTSAKKTLLIAEDEPELLEIYSRWLERLGYRVLKATGGREAFTLCQQQNVDLVISDVRMAAGNGIELARLLRAKTDASPLFIFNTGFADLSLEDAYELGACAILNKPLLREDLVRAVERYLKALRDLWSEPLPVAPEMSLRKDYESVDSAVQRGQLSFGRGGIFVSNVAEPLAEGVPLELELNFAAGRAQRFEGAGILRWQRETPREDLPPGVGIEIFNLRKDALGPVLDLIAEVKPRSFIPIR